MAATGPAAESSQSPGPCAEHVAVDRMCVPQIRVLKPVPQCGVLGGGEAASILTPGSSQAPPSRPSALARGPPAPASPAVGGPRGGTAQEMGSFAQTCSLWLTGEGQGLGTRMPPARLLARSGPGPASLLLASSSLARVPRAPGSHPRVASGGDGGSGGTAPPGTQAPLVKRRRTRRCEASFSHADFTRPSTALR